MSRSRVPMSIAAVAAALVALAAARPGPHEVPRMLLADVVGHTACPLRVVVDEDPLRLPRRIKFLTCDRAAPRRCCRGREPLAQCVEVLDEVVVQFLPRPDADPRDAAPHVLQVPVGCSCVLRAATPALEDD